MLQTMETHVIPERLSSEKHALGESNDVRDAQLENCVQRIDGDEQEKTAPRARAYPRAATYLIRWLAKPELFTRRLAIDIAHPAARIHARDFWHSLEICDTPLVWPASLETSAALLVYRKGRRRWNGTGHERATPRRASDCHEQMRFAGGWKIAP
ncbi:hypothetical protein MSAN_00914100 [Mycena sanguinolenta]|uniref:Uncharacterized protein n=1 Tax=Mycena sanguinolenta TaxID=230812 RepID=A0A8H7DBD9_9AGAR|nr:hypothetical protein MSAN_00914100 [Mycena sanguinolenta]